MKHERLFLIISCPCNKVSHFFWNYQFFHQCPTIRRKKLLYTALYLLFHELSNFELYPLLYYIYSGKGKKMTESPVVWVRVVLSNLAEGLQRTRLYTMTWRERWRQARRESPPIIVPGIWHAHIHSSNMPWSNVKHTLIKLYIIFDKQRMDK
jgi:hypothetical protein